MKKINKFGSEKYGTAVMKSEEALLYIEAVLENGYSIKEAISDMRFIDTLLQMKRLHIATIHYRKYTASGNLRKDRLLSDSLMSIVNGYVNL